MIDRDTLLEICGRDVSSCRKPPSRLVLHCARCNSELATKCTSTQTGYWCDKCYYPPSLEDTYLAVPKPKVRSAYDDQVDRFFNELSDGNVWNTK